MILHEFEWDRHNVDHIARHRVEPDEVEEIFESRHYVAGVKDGRYMVLGQSAAGRYLFCVIERSTQSGAYRVVTARDMELRERKLYMRKK